MDDGHKESTRNLAGLLKDVLEHGEFSFGPESLVELVSYMQAQQSFNVSLMKALIQVIAGNFDRNDFNVMFERESQVTLHANEFLESLMKKTVSNK